MALTARAQWKEITIVRDEEGREFVFDSAWGVTPGEAYVPIEEDWRRCVPDWLADRRDEVIKAIEGTGQVVKNSRYPYLDER
jgi:hypothetical protein